MIRYIATGLILIALAGYLLLPADKRSEFESGAGRLNAETRQLLEGYCGETLDLPREYIIAATRKMFPDYPEDGVCGLLKGHIADDAINQG